MKRFFLIAVFFVGIIYALPLITDKENLEHIDLSFVSDFTINFASSINSTENSKDDIICVNISGENTNINIDDFLVGVLAAEMPASFEIEALKAQAVAGRTYIYYKQALIYDNLADNTHPDAVVCDNPSHCKAYINLKTSNPWGERYDEYFQKIQNAVLETSGEFVVYDDAPIAAVFHSTSSGNTEAAVDVWGSDIPYLQAVSCDGSLSSPKFEESFSFTHDVFTKTILQKYPTADFSSPATTWFNTSTRSESGGIISVFVGGVEIKGTELREMFGLNSTNFTVKYTDELVIITTLGYGHGVGLSQYGANALALDGFSYKEILSHYYIDTLIKKNTYS